MELTKYDNPVTLQEAFTQIAANNNQGFIWLPVKTKSNCFVELGGCYHNNEKQIKAYIPKVVDGKIVSYTNGFVELYFSYTLEQLGIDGSNFCFITETNTKRKVDIDKFKSVEEFLEFLDSTPLEIHEFVDANLN
jgi:hypothetical protein